MNFKDFISWLLTGVITLLIIVLGYFGDRALNELVLIRGEITDLNVKLVSVVSNQQFTEKRIDKLEDRVQLLEHKR